MLRIVEFLVVLTGPGHLPRRLQTALEAGFVDYGTDEVGKVGRVADLEGLCLGNKLLLEFGPYRFRHICARARTALLTLELESSSYCLNGCVGDIGTVVY